MVIDVDVVVTDGSAVIACGHKSDNAASIIVVSFKADVADNITSAACPTKDRSSPASAPGVMPIANKSGCSCIPNE